MYKYQLQLPQATQNEQILFDVLDSVLKQQQHQLNSASSSASSSSSSSSSALINQRTEIPVRPRRKRRSSKRTSSSRQSNTDTTSNPINPTTTTNNDNENNEEFEDVFVEDHLVGPVPSLIAYAATGSSAQADKKQTAFAQQLAKQLEQHSWDALEWDVFVDTDIRGSQRKKSHGKSKRRASTTDVAKPLSYAHKLVEQQQQQQQNKNTRVGASGQRPLSRHNRRVSKSYTALNTMWLLSAEEEVAQQALGPVKPIEWTPLLPMTKAKANNKLSPIAAYDARALLGSLEELRLKGC